MSNEDSIIVLLAIGILVAAALVALRPFHCSGALKRLPKEPFSSVAVLNDDRPVVIAPTTMQPAIPMMVMVPTVVPAMMMTVSDDDPLGAGRPDECNGSKCSQSDKDFAHWSLQMVQEKKCGGTLWRSPTLCRNFLNRRSDSEEQDLLFAVFLP
jgi:hypothetical protein